MSVTSGPTTNEFTVCFVYIDRVLVAAAAAAVVFLSSLLPSSRIRFLFHSHVKRHYFIGRMRLWFYSEIV